MPRAVVVAMTENATVTAARTAGKPRFAPTAAKEALDQVRESHQSAGPNGSGLIEKRDPEFR